MNHRGAGISFLGFGLIVYLARYSTLIGGLSFAEAAPLLQWLLVVVGLGYLVVAELFPDRPRKP